MKKSILMLFAFVAMSTTAFAQEGSTRSFSMYMDGNSGQLLQESGYDKEVDDSRMFEGACVEVGLGFGHSFDNGFGYSVDAVVQNPQADGNGTGGANVWDYLKTKIGVSYGVAGFGSYISVNTDYAIEFGAGYGMDFGNAGAVSFGTDFCLTPLTQYYTGSVDTGYTDKPSDGGYEVADDTVYNKVIGVLDLFQVYVGYSIGFAENWGFDTKAMFRFGGNESDKSAFDFGQSFYIRWDNTISYQASDNLGVWARVRYQGNGLATKVQDGTNDAWKSGADHTLQLLAGVSYGFDF